MDVTKRSFPGRLLEILEHMSNAEFVCIDLELSGVASRSHNRTEQQTLEDRYQEVKAAAERYTILQIGLTFVTLSRNEDENVYITRPYNFNLDPVIEQDLELERIFAFQSGAVKFLRAHNFNIAEPFENGVPYLSRDEAVRAKKIAMARIDRTAYEDLQIPEEDKENISLIENIRKQVTLWVMDAEIKKAANLPFRSLTIPSIDSATIPQTPKQRLSRFQKRLIHQLVRAEFPDLISTPSRDESLRIAFKDPVREKEIRQKRKRDIEERIYNQKGFQWIVEALCGGKLDKLDLKSLTKDPITGGNIFYDEEDFKARFYSAKERLRCRQPVLVGHNLFTDLIYFYNTFIDKLPASLEDFTIALHSLIPTIIDTKYVATHGQVNFSSQSSLEQLEEQHRGQKLPVIQTPPAFDKYHLEENARFHEAGYDSYLTALLMIRLSARLAATGEYLSNPAVKSAHLNNDNLDGGVKLSPLTDSFATVQVEDQTNENEWDDTAATLAAQRIESSQIAKEKIPLNPEEWREHARAGALVPPFYSAFWIIYGNRLRVYGTKEELWELD
jgi:poly(A)-specific ribonuclease